MSRRSWLKLGNMSSSYAGNSKPLLSDVPEDAVSPSPPQSSRSVSPEHRENGGLSRREDLAEKSLQSAGSAPPLPGEDVVVRVLSRDTPSLSGLSMSPPDGSRKKRLVWADDFSDSRDMSIDGFGRRPSSQLEVNGQGPRERQQSYVLFEGKDGDGEKFLHVQREDEMRRSFAGNSIISEGDITENQFNYRSDFITVDVPSANPDGTSITTAQELQICKKTVLKPYIIFLKMIGWRAFYSSRQDLSPARWVRVLNVVYPSVLFLFLTFTCITQILTCFYRDAPSHSKGRMEMHGAVVISCHQDLFTRLIFPDLLLLVAYLWGLYVFRFGAPEHLISLVETVFLGTQQIRHGQSKMVTFMRLIMLAGVIWIMFDVIISVGRLFSLELLDSKSYLNFITFQNTSALNNMSFHSAKEDILRFTFVVFDFIGFILFDLLYIAVVISYASQCQLLRLYIGTIIDRVLTKLQGYTLEQAMTDINQTYQFLKVLNGKLSVLTTVCLLIFIEAAGSSLYMALKLDLTNPAKGNRVYLSLAVGICNTILWSIASLMPIVQAARLTSRCQQLRRLGLSVGHRPFAYHNTHQLLLDSFVQYTDATRYRAKLAGVPIYPSYVIGGLFLGVLGGLLLLMVIPSVAVIDWF